MVVLRWLLLVASVGGFAFAAYIDGYEASRPEQHTLMRLVALFLALNATYVWKAGSDGRKSALARLLETWIETKQAELEFRKRSAQKDVDVGGG